MLRAAARRRWRTALMSGVRDDGAAEVLRLALLAIDAASGCNPETLAGDSLARGPHTCCLAKKRAEAVRGTSYPRNIQASTRPNHAISNAIWNWRLAGVQVDIDMCVYVSACISIFATPCADVRCPRKSWLPPQESPVSAARPARRPTRLTQAAQVA